MATLASLLLATSQFAPLIPAWEKLPEIPGSHHLDYAHTTPGLFAPLTDAFIAQALGTRRDRTASPTGSTTAASPRSARSPLSTLGAASSGRTVVDHSLTNDHIADAYVVSAVPFTAKTNSSGATREPGEPSGCAPSGPTIWYRYVPAQSEGLIASTIGTPRATTLAVFAGSPGDLEETRCHRNVQGNSQVTFVAEAGVTYFFQVTTPAGGGPTVFNLDPLGTTERVSVSSRGEEAHGYMDLHALSADGRWVVFTSDAPGLVAGDTNETWDVFVHDRATARTTRVSVASDGTEANGPSHDVHGGISADGRYVAFSSWASNLVAGDTNDWIDVFVHDRWTGTTERVSVSSTGDEGEAPIDPLCDGVCWGGVSISADGRFVAFHSNMRGLVPGDDNEHIDIRPGTHVYNRTHHHGIDVFVHDRWTGETTMVSVHSDGTHGNDKSGLPRISADGRRVVFGSLADNLVDDDTNEAVDIFVHDRDTGETKRVSVDSEGRQGDDHSGGPPDISGSGRYVAFPSWAENLVAGDTNRSLDVFVHDLETGQTSRVSVTSDGEQQVGLQDPFTRDIVQSLWVSISADGRFVAFHSAASSMSPGRDDAPLAQWQGVFVHDRLTGTTIEPTLATQGKKGRPWSSQPVLSADGRAVAFMSQDAGLVEDDNNRDPYPGTGTGDDIFVHTFPMLR